MIVNIFKNRSFCFNHYTFFWQRDNVNTFPQLFILSISQVVSLFIMLYIRPFYTFTKQVIIYWLRKKNLVIFSMPFVYVVTLTNIEVRVFAFFFNANISNNFYHWYGSILILLININTINID